MKFLMPFIFVICLNAQNNRQRLVPVPVVPPGTTAAVSLALEVNTLKNENSLLKLQVDELTAMVNAWIAIAWSPDVAAAQARVQAGQAQAKTRAFVPKGTQP